MKTDIKRVLHRLVSIQLIEYPNAALPFTVSINNRRIQGGGNTLGEAVYRALAICGVVVNKFNVYSITRYIRKIHRNVINWQIATSALVTEMNRLSELGQYNQYDLSLFTKD